MALNQATTPPETVKTPQNQDKTRKTACQQLNGKGIYDESQGPLAEADGNRTRRGSYDPPPVLKTGEPTRRSLASDLKGTGERLLP